MVQGISRRKWAPCLPKLKFVLKKNNNLHPFYYPGAPGDGEKYVEFLVKVKDIKRKIQNGVRGRS